MMCRSDRWCGPFVVSFLGMAMALATISDMGGAAQPKSVAKCVRKDRQAEEGSGLLPKPKWELLDFGEYGSSDGTVRKHHIKRMRIMLPEKKATPWGASLVGDKPVVYVIEDPHVLEAIEVFLRNPLRLVLAENADVTVGDMYVVGKIVVSTNTEEFPIYITPSAFLLGDDSPLISRAFFSWGLAHVLDDVCSREAGTHISAEVMRWLSGEWRTERDKEVFGELKKTSELDKLLEEIQNVQRSLSSGSTVGANVVKDGRWYVLGASEILAVRTILKEAKRQYDSGPFPAQYRLPEYSIVLWGVADGRVVPLQVLWVNRSVSRFELFGEKAGSYLVRDGKERETLRTLIDRIREGREQPVAKVNGKGPMK
jgi:hypothetical protein